MGYYNYMEKDEDNIWSEGDEDLYDGDGVYESVFDDIWDDFDIKGWAEDQYSWDDLFDMLSNGDTYDDIYDRAREACEDDVSYMVSSAIDGADDDGYFEIDGRDFYVARCVAGEF